MTNINRDLGTDTELRTLVSKIQGYDYDNATSDDHLALTRALKILAEDMVQRHATITAHELELKRKLSLAEVTSELDGVLKALHPPVKRRGWFRR